MRDSSLVEGCAFNDSRDFGGSMPATRCRTATKLLRIYPEELAHNTARAEVCVPMSACSSRQTMCTRGWQTERSK